MRLEKFRRVWFDFPGNYIKDRSELKELLYNEDGSEFEGKEESLEDFCFCECCGESLASHEEISGICDYCYEDEYEEEEYDDKEEEEEEFCRCCNTRTNWPQDD